MRRLLWAILAAAWLGLICWGVANADQPGNAAVIVVPAGSAAGVRLRAQTVDVTLSEDKQGVWADTQVWLQLSNPLTRAVTLTLSLPGPQLTPGELPANLQLKLGDVTLAPQPAAQSAAGQTVLVPLAGKEESGLQLSYHQALPEAGGRVVFAYPLSATAKWGGTPESVRLTVNYASAPAPEQILGMVPEPERANSQTLVWNWEYEAAPDVWLAFLKPSWWANFSAARAAAAAAGAGPAQHLALSQLYQQLAGLPGLDALPELDFYARYYPAAVAELQAASAPQGNAAPLPEQVTAHAILARLYRDQANRLGGAGGSTYLELAAAEGQAALAAGSTDAGLRSLVSEAYLQLAAAARGRGDVAAADGYLARLAAVEPASRVSSATEEQKAARLALAAQQISRGNFDTARQIVAESFGRDAVDIPALAAPLARQVLVSVETTIAAEPAVPGSSLGGRRQITLTFADGRDPATLKAMIDQVGEAWRPLNQVTVSSGADWLAAAFAFADDRSLGETQMRLARLLPADAELALLAAVLSPQALSMRTGEEQFQLAQRYLESVDLAAASDAWKERALEIRTAGRRLAATSVVSPTLTPGPPGGSNGAPAATATAQAAEEGSLGQVQLALWDANAETWEALAGRSFARYSVTIGSGAPAREWQVPAGARRTLTAQTLVWRGERLAVLAACGVLALLLVAFVVWRWL